MMAGASFHVSRFTCHQLGRVVAACGLLVFAAAVPATAQETGTPVFHAPYRSSLRYEFGVAASFQRAYQTGIEAHYGHAVGPVDIAVRAGRMIRDDVQDSFLIGVQARVPVVPEERFPARGALVAGVGLDVSGGASLWVPIGLSLGRRLLVEKSVVSFVPFVQPTVYFTTVGSEIAAGLGLGLDLRISTGFAFSVSGGVGTGAAPEGVAATVAWLH
jgi:hypothetical protein